MKCNQRTHALDGFAHQDVVGIIKPKSNFAFRGWVGGRDPIVFIAFTPMQMSNKFLNGILICFWKVVISVFIMILFSLFCLHFVYKSLGLLLHLSTRLK